MRDEREVTLALDSTTNQRIRCCTGSSRSNYWLHWEMSVGANVMIVGKRALCGYGEVCASALRGSGARMLFAEVTPLCLAGVQVVAIETIMSEIDIFASTGNCNIISLDDMKKL